MAELAVLRKRAPTKSSRGVLSLGKGQAMGSIDRIEELCDQFESGWLHGNRPRIEDCLAAVAGSGEMLLFANY